MRNHLTAWLKTFGIVVGLLVFLVAGLYVYSKLTWKPLTYDDAYDEAHWQIKRLCRELKREPCDYKLTKVSSVKTQEASWTFNFQSRYHASITVIVWKDGDVDVAIN